MQDKESMPEPIFSPDIEKRVMEVGCEILERAKEIQAKQGTGERWVNELLERSMADEAFRVKALRFVDVLPALKSDKELLRHLHEYFDPEELPLPKPVRALFANSTGTMAATMISPFIRRGVTALSDRFLGGTTLHEVQATLDRQARNGAAVSLDHLGEAVVSDAEAEEYLQGYHEMLDNLRTSNSHQGGLNLSVKISSLYPRMVARDPDGAIDAVIKRLKPLMVKAMEKDISMCLDMEQYDLKGIILGVFKQVMQEPELKCWEGGGIALQSYLKDSVRDLDVLIKWAETRGKSVTIRLVRGAYWDQEMILSRREGWPLPVWPYKHQTDRSFEQCLKKLFQNHELLRPAVASHNVRSIALAMVLADENRLGNDEFEFQMLYGMGDALRNSIMDMGYQVRLYTPFGEILPGMAYLVRRILENSSSQSFLHLGYLPKETPEKQLAPSYGINAPEPDPVSTVNEFRNEPVQRFTDPGERDGFIQALALVKEQLGADYSILIDGNEIETGRVIKSVNPARPDEVVGSVQSAGSDEAEQAVTSAASAFESWKNSSIEDRAGLLRKVASSLRERRNEFAAWEVYEAGKNWPEADADVTETIDFLEYYALEAERMNVVQSLDVMGETNRYQYAPRGVALVLPPWNFPLAIVTGMLSAALVTGNTVVLKPSSQTPVVSAKMIELLLEAGVPDGVVNFLPGPGREVGEYLVKHPKVSIIAFTGSVQVGLRINQLAATPNAEQVHVKKVIAEMGGKNAIIVDSSADLDEAVIGTVASAFGFQGQKCSACSRVIVVGSAYDQFKKRLVDAVASIRIGPPEQPGVDLGPVIESAAKERIESIIKLESESNSPAIRMDVSSCGPGYFVGPTLFTEVNPDSPIAQEEIFGPVLALIKADDFTHALEIANGTRYALTGGVYSRSPENLRRSAEEFQVGNLYLNRGITGALVGRQPFGGFKMSGVGSKAGGPDYLLQFMEPRTVTENTMRRGYAPMDNQGT